MPLCKSHSPRLDRSYYPFAVQVRKLYIMIFYPRRSKEATGIRWCDGRRNITPQRGSAAAWKTIGIASVAALAASHLTAHQVGRQLRQSIELILGEAIDDCYVLALHIADVLEAQAECAQTVRHRVRRSGVEEPNHRHRRLLRSRRERPCRRCTAEQRDELAALHSITSSAAA